MTNILLNQVANLVEEDLIDLPRLFQRQVDATPDAIAIFFEEDRVTYRQLNAYANQIAHDLLSQDATPQQCIGLCLDRSIDAIAAMLGVLKAHMVFVPLDPEFPADRLAYIVDDAGIDRIICDPRYRELYGKTGDCETGDSERMPLHLVDLANLQTDTLPTSNPDDALQIQVSPESLAYIMYTSGSTGKPKGVQIEHRALATYCFADIAEYQLRVEDRTLQFSTLNFDIAIEEIFPPLLMGSSVVVRPRARAQAQIELSSIVETFGVTAIHLATAYWHEWVDLMQSSGARVPATIRLMVVTGEKVSAEHYRRWLTLCDHDTLWCNAYGPTEATVSATVFTPPRDWSGDNMPIGKPLKRYSAYILDSDHQPVTAGETGELCIGGPALARGYLNREDLTAKAFFTLSIADTAPQTLYRTGDLARWLPNGDIEFAGRKDHQIKLGSYRIEPGEIEAILNQHPQVLESLISHDEVQGKKFLIAYVAHGNRQIDLADLSRHLRDRLPTYMIPSRFVLVDSFPKTINGKIDRDALPAAETSVVPRDTDYAAPTTELEKDLTTIWSEVLHVPQVGIHDDFFTLGGSSLLVTRVISQIGQHLKTEIPVRDFFANPTVASIARHITRLNSPDATADDSGTTSWALRKHLPTIEAQYFPADDARLFGVHYHPVGQDRDHAVLLCPSLGHEYSRAHRNLQQLAIQLAKNGFHTLRFDYSHTGNSLGDVALGCANLWKQDIQDAANYLRQRSQATKLTVVGIRLGATLAANIVPHKEATAIADSIVLWDPVVSGSGLLNLIDGFHAQLLSNYSHFPVKRRRGEQDQAFGLALSPTKRQSIAELQLPKGQTSGSAQPTLIVTSRDYVEHEKGLEIPAGAAHAKTDDDIHWHSADFTEVAFASREAYGAIIQFIREAQ